jgi:hypothetical protein
MPGYHDDCLMALAMCLWVAEHSFKNLERLEKQNKAMLNAWLGGNSTTNTNNNRTAFVTNENGVKKAHPKPRFNPYKGNGLQDPNGDYLWLFNGMK